jgi:hypothetical protein
MLKTKAIAVVLFAILALGACKPQAAPSSLSAALSELQGKVDLKQAGSNTFAPAAADSHLDVNGQIQTGDDGRVRLDLSTGTIIRVAPSSLFTLTSNDEVEGGLATKIKLEAGKLFIILNGGNTDVETPSGVASVRGSYMSVWVDTVTGDVHVTCMEGHCKATNEGGAADLVAGESTILFHQNDDGSWTVPEVGQMTPEEFQEWLDENPEAQELFNQAMATKTALAAPSPTTEPTATPEATLESALPPGGSSGGCFNVIEPLAGSELPFQGKVKFEWESQPGATKYILAFKDANGQIMSFDTTDTSIEKYIEILPKEGQYSWDVTAYGDDGSEICKTATESFSKPNSKIEPKIDTSGSDQAPACDPMDCYGSCPGQTCGG